MRKYLVSIALATIAALSLMLAAIGPTAAGQVMIGGVLHQMFVQANPQTGQPFPVNVTPTNRSGTITTLNVSQQLMAANTARRGFMVQNSGAAALWINELGAAATTAQPSIQIAVGATYQSPDGAASPAAINIIGGTTGQAFTAREW